MTPAPAPRISPCPVCGTACMRPVVCSEFGYHGDVCSRECARKAGAAVKVLHRSAEWRQAEKDQAVILDRMRAMEAAAVLGIKDNP